MTRRIVRLVIGVVLVAAALVLGRMMHPGQHPASGVTVAAPVVSASPTPSPTPSPTSASATPSPAVSAKPIPKVSAADPTPTVARPHLAPQAVSERFVLAWLDTHRGDKRAWLEGMRPWTDPSYIDALATTDLANVWRAKVTARATVVDLPVKGGRAVVHVPTSMRTLEVTLWIIDGYWVVSSLDEAQS